MATTGQWIEAVRLRTLPAAVSPVLAGTAIALHHGAFHPLRALLALVVALALQIGVNFANDYSDGIRGSDEQRVGPMRLVGSGAAPPQTVKSAAFACFGLAGLAGLGLVILTGHWWLIAVGVAAILAAWYYTGGKRPYGYAGLGEVFVFIFFGLVAVGGTTFVQSGRIDAATIWAATCVGALACAILVCNNLRDIDGDRLVGKRTLATRMGDRGSRALFVLLCVVAVIAVIVIAALTTWWALLGLVMLVPMLAAIKILASGATGLALVRALKLIGIAELVGAAGLLLGHAIAVWMH